MLVLGIIEWVQKSRQQSDNITKLEHGIKLLRQERTEAMLKTTGRLEDVSPVETDLIIAMSIELEGRHGYNDFTGLLADRASGVPLNELKIRPCSQCGIPRNQKGNHGK